MTIVEAFFLNYPQIGQTLSAQFKTEAGNEIVQTLSAQFDGSILRPDQVIDLAATATSESLINPELLLTRLSFSQFVELLKLDHELMRSFYEIEAIKGNWSVRELKRQIGSLLYERTGFSKDREKLIDLTNSQANQLTVGDVIRDPYIFEFLDLPAKDVIEESDLEQPAIAGTPADEAQIRGIGIPFSVGLVVRA